MLDMDTRCLVHEHPVWKERANFIIGAWLPHLEGSTILEWEQLWARQITEHVFELCCIPLYVYDLALGDHVEAATEMEEIHMVQRAVRRYGHWTLRAWFKDLADPATRQEIKEELTKLGCLTEWGSENLLGIDAPSDKIARTIVQFLHRQEQLGHLLYETGWA